MGLSDNERYRKILYTAKHLYMLKETWKQELEYNKDYLDPNCKKLLNAIEDLWNVIFNNDSNSVHWIIGSSSVNKITEDEQTTPWEVAIVNSLENIHKDDIFSFSDESYNDEHFPSMEQIISASNNKNLRHVYKIYQYAESFSYALRRYNDDFRKSFSSLDKLLNEIYGICFCIFDAKEDFAKAYLINEIKDILYAQHYPYNEKEYDVVTQLMVKYNCKYDFTYLIKFPLVDISNIHIDLIKCKVSKARNSSYKFLEQRMIALLKFIKKENIEKILSDEKLLDSSLKNSLRKFSKVSRLEKDVTINCDANDDYKEFACYGYKGYSILREKD